MAHLCPFLHPPLRSSPLANMRGASPDSSDSDLELETAVDFPALLAVAATRGLASTVGCAAGTDYAATRALVHELIIFNSIKHACPHVCMWGCLWPSINNNFQETLTIL